MYLSRYYQNISKYLDLAYTPACALRQKSKYIRHIRNSVAWVIPSFEDNIPQLPISWFAAYYEAYVVSGKTPIALVTDKFLKTWI